VGDKVICIRRNSLLAPPLKLHKIYTVQKVLCHNEMIKVQGSGFEWLSNRFKKANKINKVLYEK
jgi:hypothetical protein